MSEAVFVEKPDQSHIHTLYSSPDYKNEEVDKKTLIIMCHHFPGNCHGTENILKDAEKTCLSLGLHTLRFDFTHCSGNDNNANNFTLGTAIEDMKILLAWATKRGFKHIGFFAEGLGALPPILLGNKYIDFIVMAYPVILIEDAYNPETISTQERDMSANLIKKLPDINIDKALESFTKPSLIFYGTNDTRFSSSHLNILKNKLGSSRIDITSINGGTYGLPEISARKALDLNLKVFLKKYAYCSEP
tara:strand:+ start:95 stop:835 length:741 start_codon:yes stop_codon:yes gene_type:complete